MEKKAVILIATIIICSLLCTVAQAAISIESSMSISGTGIIDHYIEAQTNYTLSGQKYTESVRTPSLGLFGVSEVDNRAEFSMLTGNESDIVVEGATTSNYIAAMYCMRNYQTDVVQEHIYRGDTTGSYEFMADDFSSLMAAEGTTSGKMEFDIISKSRDTHKTLYNEKFEFFGVLDYVIENYIENVTYPGAGNGDWLGCP